MGQIEEDGGTCHHVGPHRIIFEASEITRVVWTGVSTAEHIQQLYDLTDAHFGAGKPFYAIVDLTRLTEATAASRKAAAAEIRTKNVKALAYVGASFHMRVVMTMFNKAMGVINPEATAPVRFCNDLKEAREWLAAQRKANATR